MTEPATPLQAARLARGWTQTSVFARLEEEAQKVDLTIPARSSLKPMLSTWENGRSRPGAMYRQLLCAVYETTEEELGLAAAEIERPGRVPRLAPAPGEETVEYFKNVFEQHLMADNLLGPHHLVEVVKAQTALLDQLLPAAAGTVREDLTRLACKYHEFTGWLYQDAGDPKTAMDYSDRAMDFALEIGDPDRRSYLLMRKTNITLDQGQPGRAIGLSNAATRDLGRVPPRIRALALSQAARAHAANGDVVECGRALEAAYREVGKPDADSGELAGYCNESYVLMEAAACWSLLGQHEQSVAIFERSLESWPAEQRRDLGLCLARLASTYAALGDVENAATVGHAALDTVQTATSVRSLIELQKLKTRLAPWRKNDQVAELTQQLTTLIK